MEDEVDDEEEEEEDDDDDDDEDDDDGDVVLAPSKYVLFIMLSNRLFMMEILPRPRLALALFATRIVVVDG